MEEHEWLAQRFDAHRTHLRAVAYRMLGSISEADDAVQQTWLRLSRSDTSGIENLGGWLTTVVGRVCLDMLRSRRSRREGPLGVHVPEPIMSRADGIDPESVALLVVLETLSPAERLASSRRSTETTARRWCPTRGPVSPPRLASAWSSAKAPPGPSSPATLPASPSADGRGGRAQRLPGASA